MSEHNVVLTVAAYSSAAAARRGFDAVGRAHETGRHRHLAAAVLDKGPDGALTIDRCDGVETDAAWGGALLGAALVVLAAPVGIDLLPAVVTAPAGWARVAASVSHYWQHVPQDTLRQMSDMLESQPVGLVVVAIDLSRHDMREIVSGASPMIVTDSTMVDLDTDLLPSIGEAMDAPSNPPSDAEGVPRWATSAPRDGDAVLGPTSVDGATADTFTDGDPRDHVP